MVHVNDLLDTIAQPLVSRACIERFIRITVEQLNLFHQEVHIHNVPKYFVWGGGGIFEFLLVICKALLQPKGLSVYHYFTL